MLRCSLLFCDPIDCSLLGSSVHGISQARILEWILICLPMQEMWVWSLGKEMATHSSSLAWEIPWTEVPGGLYIPRDCKRVGRDLVTKQQQQSLRYMIWFYIFLYWKVIAKFLYWKMISMVSMVNTFITILYICKLLKE